MAGSKAGGTASASAIRIRENQRRSRARRKEYVESMERKVQEFERRGVEATLEMQQAARTVAVENGRLRLMLAQMGAGAADVDAFLQAFQDRDAAQTLSSVRLLSADRAVELPAAADDDDDDDDDGPAAHDLRPPGLSGRGIHIAVPVPVPVPAAIPGIHGGPPRPERPQPWAAAFDKLDVLASASVQQGGGCDDRARQAGAESPSTLEPSPGAATPTSPSPRGAGLDSPLTMSCDAAAQIIAEMQGGPVKQEPGCRRHNDDDCFVDDTVLFQVIEHGGRFS